MNRLAVSLASLALAAPAYAGVVYVPLPGYESVGGVAVAHRILVSNPDAAARSYQFLVLPQNVDGTEQGEAPPASAVAAGQTLELSADAASRGLLQFDSAAELVWAARLVRPAESGLAPTLLPVITSDEVVPADGDIELLGWQRSASRATDFVLVNLGHEDSDCGIKVFRADGTQIQSSIVVRMWALSSRLYQDALAILGVTQVEDARLAVTCDQPFYAFSLIRDVDTGEVSFQGPAAEGDSTLTLPDDGPGAECPAGAICFSRPGVFYVPTPQESVRRETFPLETGSYSKLHFRVEVVHGGWKSPTDGLHSLWWLALNRHFRLVGFSGLHGPNKNDLLFRHGMNVSAASKAKFTPAFVATPGQTYVCDFVFDPAGRTLRYQVLDLAGNVLLSITDRPNVNMLHVEEGEDLVADFSYEAGANAVEPPTYGWQYKNLTLEVFP